MAVVQLLPSLDISILKVYDVGDVSVMVTRVFMVSGPIFISLVQLQVLPSRCPVAEKAGMLLSTGCLRHQVLVM